MVPCYYGLTFPVYQGPRAYISLGSMTPATALNVTYAFETTMDILRDSWNQVQSRRSFKMDFDAYEDLSSPKTRRRAFWNKPQQI